MRSITQRSIKSALLCGVVIAVLSGAGAAAAQGSQTAIDMPAQPLAKALDQVARRTGVDILYTPEAVAHIQAPALHGSFTARDAVKRLLAGQALDVAQDGSGAVVVRPPARTPEGASARPQSGAEGTEAASLVAEVLVTGAREAREDALRRKRRSDNLREVATSDDVGKLPDSSLADALGRLAGVSVTDSNGEGRFVSIRGIPPELNMVTVNGQPSAVPDVDGRAGRAGPLDVIGAGDFAQVEVIKSLRPDLDAQGLGGTINVNTPSAFSTDRRFGYARAEKGWNSQTSDAGIYSASLGFGDRYFDRTVGLYVGGSYSTLESHNEALSGENWAKRGDIYLPDRVRLDDIYSTVERYALSTNLEYRPDDRLRTYVRASYNSYNDDELRPETEIRLRGSPVFTGPGVGTSSSASVDMETRQEVTERYIFNLSSGARRTFGQDDRFELEGQFTYSKASEKNPKLNYYEFNMGARPPATFDATGDFPLVDLGAPRMSPAEYRLDQVRYETSLQEEQIYVPSVDFTWRTQLFGADAKLKVGGKATIRDRFIDDNSRRFQPIGALTLTDFAMFGPSDFRGGYAYGPAADPRAVDRFFAANPGRFTFNAQDSTINSAEDDYDIDERVYAGYAMLTVDTGRLLVVGGVRVERTDVKIAANQAVYNDGEFQGLEPRSGKSEFTDIFPSLQARYEVNDKLQVRAAVTTSIGRPDFVDLAPISSLDFTESIPGSGIFSGSLDEGNPELKPFRAINLDASVEYYFNKSSLLSAGVFYKKISDPIFRRRQVLTNVEVDGRMFEDLQLTRMENAEDGSIAGLELSYQQQFDFLPGLLRGLGVSANATLITSKLKVFDRPDKLPFIGQPDEVYNLQVFYELGRVEARVGYQQTSKRLTTLVLPGADYYRDESKDLSAQISVKLTDRLFAYAEAQNLLNDESTVYQGVLGNTVSNQIYGRTFRLGLSARF